MRWRIGILTLMIYTNIKNKETQPFLLKYLHRYILHLEVIYVTPSTRGR